MSRHATSKLMTNFQKTRSGRSQAKGHLVLLAAPYYFVLCCVEEIAVLSPFQLSAIGMKSTVHNPEEHMAIVRALVKVIRGSDLQLTSLL